MDSFCFILPPNSYFLPFPLSLLLPPLPLKAAAAVALLLVPSPTLN